MCVWCDGAEYVCNVVFMVCDGVWLIFGGDGVCVGGGGGEKDRYT